jgi:hypothetical protein
MGGRGNNTHEVRLKRWSPVQHTGSWKKQMTQFIRAFYQVKMTLGLLAARVISAPRPRGNRRFWKPDMERGRGVKEMIERIGGEGRGERPLARLD